MSRLEAPDSPTEFRIKSVAGRMFRGKVAADGEPLPEQRHLSTLILLRYTHTGRDCRPASLVVDLLIVVICGFHGPIAAGIRQQEQEGCPHIAAGKGRLQRGAHVIAAGFGLPLRQARQ